ncbi:AI-2E family transporter [bacterium]|nr:AI-2E family transporter [bacterium]
MFESNFSKYLTSKNIIFFVILVLFIIFVSRIKDIAIMFFASYVIACSMEPVVQKLSTKFKRSTAGAITLIGSILIVCIFFVPIIIIGGYEIRELAISFPQYADTVKEYIVGLPFVSGFAFEQLDVGGMLSSASSVTTKIIQESINIGKNLGSGFVYLLVSILLIYYFIVDRDAVRSAVIKMFPKPMRKRADEIMDSIAEKIGGYVIAQLITIASVGVIMTIGLFILRIDYALILGLITAILDIIPVIGPAIALVICLVVCYKSGFGMLALITLVFAIAQLTENNFVRPYVFGKFLDLHPILIFLFILVAAKYMGIVGVIFAPAMAATVVVLIEEVYMKSLE